MAKCLFSSVFSVKALAGEGPCRGFFHDCKTLRNLREPSFEALAPGAAPPPPRGPQLRHRRREPGGQLPRVRGLLAGQVPHPGGGQLLQQHAGPRHHRDQGLRGRHVSGV